MNRNASYLTVGVTLVAVLCMIEPASGQTAPSLGSAQSFAVLAGAAVTNTGATTAAGDVGVFPGSAISGFPPGIITSGTIHAADAAAQLAQNAVTTAYNSLASQPCTQDLTGQDLGGLTLTSGVYCFSSSAQLTGTLTLDAQGNPNAVFIFRVGSALTTASASAVSMINGASACNVFWQIGSSATLGTATSFVGNVLALTSITMNTGASLAGRALARNGAVTLQSNTINPPCHVPSGPTCPAITLSPGTLPAGQAGVAYVQQLTASGGTGPYTFLITSGALPPGLQLTPTGLLAGTPTAGSFGFTVRATDANGCFVAISYVVVIAAAPAPPPNCPAITLNTNLPSNIVVGVPFTLTLTSSGGVPPYTYGVTAGVLPAGVTLTAAGVLSGTATTPGNFAFTIRVTDSNGCFAERPYAGTIVMAVPTLPQMFAGLLAVGLLGMGYARLRRGGLGTMSPGRPH